MKRRKPIRATVRLYLDKPERETTSLMIRVSIQGERKSYGTGEILKAKEWDDKKKCIKHSVRRAMERNRYLFNLCEDIHSVAEVCSTVAEAHEAVRAFFAEEKKEDEPNAPAPLLWQHAYDYVKHLKAIGRKQTTLTGYKVLADEIKHLAPDLATADFNSDFVGVWLDYLQMKESQVTTVGKKVQRFNSLQIYIRTYHDSSFQPIHIDKPSGSDNHKLKEWLTKDELLRVSDYFFSSAKDDSVTKAAAIFLAMALTGVRHSDVKHLRSDNIRQVSDRQGHSFNELSFTVTKTGQQLSFAVSEKLLNILSEYEGVLPDYTTQSLNNILPKVAKACGIDKHLTTHVARNTFASLAYLNQQPIEVISKMLGHSSYDQTLKYCKSLRGLSDSSRIDLL